MSVCLSQGRLHGDRLRNLPSSRHRTPHCLPNIPLLPTSWPSFPRPRTDEVGALTASGGRRKDLRVGCQSSREVFGHGVGGGPSRTAGREGGRALGVCKGGRCKERAPRRTEFLSQDFSCCSPRQSKEPDRGPRAPRVSPWNGTLKFRPLRGSAKAERGGRSPNFGSRRHLAPSLRCEAPEPAAKSNEVWRATREAGLRAASGTVPTHCPVSFSPRHARLKAPRRPGSVER